MPPESVRVLMTALQERGVESCVGGGWAVDAMVGSQTRQHADLDLWADANDFEGLLAAFVDEGVDRIYPWPGDRPWNFVLHDGDSRRVDLHLYETLSDGRLHYGSVRAPFMFTDHDLSGEGEIAGIPVRCERPAFALQNHTGYELREIDRHDVAVLCERLGLQPPEEYR
ncbi:MAG: nucleotidyltransferase domain-containing protein [Nocardioides sp.]